MSLLVATAVSPTDPAVVFSVLGQREVEGRSGTILEGESGANDPVGIALMASLLAAGGLTGHAFVDIGGQFLLQMGVGAAIGVLGGRALLWFMRRVPLPSEGLYPLRTLACVLVLYGAATLAHGSGFLAVFVAGILIGDGRAPYKREIERFHWGAGQPGGDRRLRRAGVDGERVGAAAAGCVGAGSGAGCGAGVADPPDRGGVVSAAGRG